MEGVVLFRVEHFQQGRRRVAVVGHLRHLVYLVEYEDRVGATGLLNALDDAAGHSTDVSASVAANLGFVVQAAKRDAHVLALHGFGDGLAQ